MARGDSLFRQWELIRTLQSHRYGLSMDELVERLECARRTVQRDLAALDAFFPITCETRDGGRKFWMLDHRAVLSDELHLSVTEMISLYLSQQLLLPLAGTQFGDGLQTALQKIRALLPQQALTHFEGLDESFFIKSLAGTDYTGQDKQIRILNEAILDRAVVRVTYFSASKGKEVTGELHPYGMVLLHASLYCVGWLSCYEEIRTLKVARVRGLTCTGKVFSKPEGFSLADHLQGAFGVFRADTTQTVRVQFTGWAATNVREMQWHRSQRIRKDDGDALTATFELGSTVEFKRWILGFGPHAKVLSPSGFAKEIKRDLSATQRLYRTI